MQKIRQILQSCLFIIIATGCLGSFKKIERALPSRGRDIEKNTIAATGKLIVLRKNNKTFRCTAFAYEHVGLTYRFITDAHCLAKDDIKNERVKIIYKSLKIFLKNKAYSAKLIGAGYQHIRDDFAILEVKLDKHIPILKLSNSRLMRFQSFLNVSYPKLADGNLFYGHVFELNGGDGDILLKVVGITYPGGASGSAIVDFYSGKVIATFFGSMKNNTVIVAIPISKFKKFEAKIKKGTYKYYKSTKKSKK